MEKYFWTHWKKNSVRLIRQDATRIDRTEKTERTSTRTSLPSVLSVTSSKYDIIRRTNNPLQTRTVDEMNTSVQLPVNFWYISGSVISILLVSLQKQMSKTTLVQSNRTSIDRSTSFFQREFKQQQAAVTTATTRSDRRSSRPERREEDDAKVSRTSRTKPEGAEEKSPLICELTRQPVAPPRRKKPVPGPVFLT